MIKPIVEGHGEVEALPVLLRRIAGECFGVWDVPLLHPGRYPAGRLLRKEENGTWVPGPDFPKAGQHARNEGATCILTLLDLDDDCPKEVHDGLFPCLPAPREWLRPASFLPSVNTRPGSWHQQKLWKTTCCPIQMIQRVSVERSGHLRATFNWSFLMMKGRISRATPAG